MGDLDTSLDAFKHLPYFKPLYTTILRQQMKYLTEQLSLHAGEESLVLTTNMVAGTISSLTSTYGTGFLDHRSDIKGQFTMHCTKSKMKQDKNRRNIHIGNLDIKEYVDPSLKRKRSEENRAHCATTDGFIELNETQSNKACHLNTLSNNKKSERELVQDMIDHGLANIEIENVRSVLPKTWLHGEHSATGGNAEKERSTKVLNCKSNLIVCGRYRMDIKKEPVEKRYVYNEFVAPNESVSRQADVIEREPKKAAICSEAVPIDTTNSNTDTCTETDYTIDRSSDDVARVRDSYLDVSEIGSSSEHMVTESDGNDMWIVAGENHEIHSKQVEDNKTNARMFSSQTSTLTSDAGVGGSVCEIITDAVQNVATNSSSTYANDPTGYVQEAQLPMLVSTSTVARIANDEARIKYTCRYCSQIFTTYSSKKRHERRHTGETPWACDVCNRKFYRKDDLRVHSLKHSGQKPFMCPVCRTGYCKKKMLEVHMAMSHGVTGVF